MCYVLVISISILKVKGEKGKTFEINLEDLLQKRYEMVRELSLSSKSRNEICARFDYSRKTGNEYLRAWKEKGWEGLNEKPRGPKTKSKRKEDVEKRILDIRFNTPDKDMYDIEEILTGEGYEISARSVARVLSEHGVTLKKKKTKPSPEP
ncbi:MAG: helix-turn-helix domain containing protein [Methanosarcinales archaeon]|nr:helix-turn-helix domain containing protein [Methanosarcinales archaeon]